MRKFFRKFLIYLLAIGMLCPAWLATGVMKPTHAKAATTTIANWDFGIDTGTVIPNIDINNDALFIDDSGGLLQYPLGNPNTGKAYSSNNWTATEYYQFNINTTGYKSIKLSLDDLATDATGPESFLVQYSINGTDFNELPNSTTLIPHDFSATPMQSYDFSTVLGTNNNVNFKVRLVVVTAGTTDTGRWRLDNVNITGDHIPLTLNSVDFAATKNAGPSDPPMTGDQTNGYTLITDGNPISQYGIQFKNTTVSESLTAISPDPLIKDGALYFDEQFSTVTAAQLATYYANRMDASLLPQNYEQYLIDAANRLEPFAYIYSNLGNAKLADGAQFNVPPTSPSKVDMAIPGDYPEGTYAISGYIKGLSSALETLVSFKLTVLKDTETTTNPTTPVIIGLNDYENQIINTNVGGSIDLSALQGGVVGAPVTLKGSITINSTTTSGQVIKVEIPAGTTITGTGSTAWTGIINLPTVTLLPSGTVLTTDTGTYTTPSEAIAIAVGMDGQTLTFNKPVKMTFFGQAGKLIGFVGSDGTFHQISACTATSSITSSSITSDECKIDATPDLIVWTMHFTTFVTYEQHPVVAPTLKVTPVTENGVNYAKVEWIGNGSEKYVIKLGDVVSVTVNVIGDDSSPATTYTRYIKVLASGKYNISMVSTKGGVDSINNLVYTIEFKVPVVAAPAPVETTPVIVGPTKVEAAAPAENKVETPSDDSAGQIKGDENASNAEEKTNWTPWIVLFVLIILAGAATGGYFYWFNGEEEVKAAAVEPKKSEVKKEENAVKTTVRNKNSQKKQKRW